MNDISNIGSSLMKPCKDPVCFLHCAIFLVDTSLINKSKINEYLKKKVINKKDLTLFNHGIISDDIFRVQSIQGQEQISGPFNFEVELHGNTDTPGGAIDIDFDQFIGRPVTLGINLPSKIFNKKYDVASHKFIDAVLGNDSGGISLFNGMITSFAIKQPGVYSLTVKPDLWKLTLTNRYSLYYKKNIKEVIAEILDRHNISYNMDGISGNDNIAITRTQDWLQAGENDYEFIQRIMGKAHIYYFFNHTATSHTAMFANRPAYPKVFPDNRSLRYAYTDESALGLNQDNVIKDYNYKKTLMSSAVSTVFATMQNSWQADPNISYQTFEADSEKQVGELPFQLYRIYQYGGSLNETADYTNKTGDTLETAKTSLSGASTYSDMRAGYKFSITSDDAKLYRNHPVRPSLEGQWFVLTQVQHHATGDGGYQNQFQATESNGLITHFDMHETRQGSMLAEVVHSDGNDALTGNPWYGAKSDFDPEQSSVSDSQAAPPPIDMNTEGVYVKLSSDGSNAKPFWVKLAPHMQQAPEVGAIVLISRSSDDSEIPEIQNVIQNNGNTTVTPSGWTTNTQVGSNYSTSYGDSKSVRFGKNSKADLDNAVSIVQQEYKTGQFKDCSYSQGASYSYSTAEKGKSGILSRSKSFGSTYSNHTGAESISYSDIDDTKNYSTISNKSYSESTIGESENITTIKGLSKSTSTIGSSINDSTINNDSTSTSLVKGDSTNTSTVDGESNNTSTIGSSVNTSTINGKSTSTSTNYGNVTNTSTINANSTSTTTISGSSTNTSTIGASNNVSLVGASANTNLTGASSNTSLTGTTLNTNVTGAAVNTNIMGGAVNTNITGATASLNVTGASASANVTGVSADVSVAKSTNSISIKQSSVSIDIAGTGLAVQEILVKTGISTTTAKIASALMVIL